MKPGPKYPEIEKSSTYCARTIPAHIPVVAMSANAMPRDIAKALKAGFFDYVTKPIKVEHFMTVLDAALNYAQTLAARGPSANR